MTTCRPSLPVRGALPAAVALSALVLAAFLPLLVGGCSRSPDKVVLATVGPHKVTQTYYEHKLARLKPEELPRDAQGQAVDTATLEGKKAFLDVIINKELMALKAEELGFGADERIAGASQVLREYHAPTYMHYDLVETPANTVSDAELEEYYQNMQTQRRCSFIICNFRSDAEKARQAVAAGGLWEDVADEYSDGSRGPNQNYTTIIPWGRLDDSFERAIFSLKEGEISQPIESVYGWWVVRVDAVEPVRVAPLESLKQRMLDSIRGRKINLGRRAFIEESRRKHDFKLNEDALWIIYQGLPENEAMLDPITNKPTPREQLQPLKINLQDMDKFFYQVRLGDKMETWTIGDYKDLYDKSNVFERPKRTELLGGLRDNIMGIIDRQLLLQEAIERGYMEDPRVTGATDERREQMMVSKLHQQVVTISETVTPEQLDQFWQENKDEYLQGETRFGKVLFCASREVAETARAEALAGKSWLELLTRHGSDADNKQNQGALGPVAATARSPLREPLFALTTIGELSPVFKIEKGWTIVRLDSTAAPRQLQLSEIAPELGQRIKQRRREEKLQELLSQWRQEFPVRIHESRLAKVRSYEQLAAMPAPQGPLSKPVVR